MLNKYKDISLSKFVFILVKEFKWQFAIMQLGMLSWAFQESLFPYLIKRITQIITDENVNKQNIFLDNKQFFITALMIYILIECGFRLHEYVALTFYPKLRQRIRELMLNYTLDHSHEFFANNYSGTIGNKIARLAEGVQDICEKVISVFTPIIVALLISIILIVQENLYLGLLIIAWFVVHFLILLNYTKRCEYYSSLHSDEVTKLNGKIIDILNNIANVRLFARNKFEIKSLMDFNKIEINASKRSGFVDFKLNISLAINTTIFIICMVTGSIYSWKEGLIELPVLVLCMSSLYVISLVWWLGYNLINFYNQVGQCDEALGLLRIQHQIQQAKDAKPLIIREGKVEFNNVKFTFKKNRSIFKNLNVIINGNQKIGLVGLSGSGKSTFANLVLRLFDIDQGKILIDDQNIYDVTIDSLREAIAFIPQDLSLFHRTVMENIRYGNINASDDEVIEAAKKAQAHDFIMNLSEGYETQVGERGIKLSGGQRQRIAIARAVLKNSKIIIMDEATSALDTITEHAIQTELYRNITDKTLIVIAHRLSTLLDMDRILVFKNGEIVEDGSHKDLLIKKGYYHELWKKQSK
ncbi:MAG: ABC transporter ATP-binding protein [Sphingobacteriia bacterium]|nr:ABC transporter ATP-binding protein [Sphingobacteriia bacterium]